MDEARLSRLTTDQAATEWLLARQRGLSDEEQSLLDAWLSRSGENAAAWKQALSLWEEFDQEPDPLLASMRSAARAMRAPVWTSFPLRALAAAAAIILCVGVASWQASIWTGHDAGRRELASSGITISSEEDRKQVALADGSKVVLDARSRIKVVFAARTRNIALLEGTAFFKVAHDSSRPFTVSANQSRIVATGTAFSVGVSGNLLQVVLVEGQVRVAGANGQVVLHPGQEYRAVGTAPGIVRDVDPDPELAWRDGYLDLNGVSIAEAVTAMNRYAKVPLTIGDAAAGAIKVTGRFRTDDPERFARTLAQMVSVKVVRRSDGGIEIRSRR